MFSHLGKTRTIEHNLKIASLLSFVAGFVNVVGYLSIQRLTTNVTGHFAFFVDDVFRLKIWDSLVFFMYIFFFFLGSFVSNTLVELISRKSEQNIFILPVMLESLLLITVALAGNYLIQGHANVIAFLLLFSMGLQNSLVTKISNALVRTTHLTGLFTDLGIEVSQLLFYPSPEQRLQLKSNIRLRLRIILFFFIGGIAGGLVYAKFGFYSLLVPAAALLIGLVYDNLKFTLLKWAK